jgi:4-amino-4-deoxy-L-arabinose transferase-like glycosyltransferase
MARAQAGHATDARTWRWLGGIIILAVVLRAGAALYMGDRVVDMPGIYDQISYDRLAQNVVAGHGFSFDVDWWPATRAGEPTAHWSFLYTLYLAAAYALAGHHPLLPRMLQAVAAGILMPLLTYQLGARIGGRLVGSVAALVSAVYIYFFYYAAALMTETFFFLAVLGSLNLALATAERPTVLRWLGLGAAMGCAALLRQTYLLFVPFLLLWIAWAGRGRVRAVQLLAPLGILALFILPWTARNYRVFHQLVLLNTNAGYVFFWANHPIQGTNFMSILGEGYPGYKDLIPSQLLGLDEAALEKALMARGLGFVTAEPGRYALLSLSRFKDYFLFWPKAGSGTLSNVSRVGSFGICLPFMIYGLILATHRAWTRRRRITDEPATRGIVLLFGFIVVYSAAHLLTWAYVRYRLPVDVVLVVFAAMAFCDLYDRLRDRKAADMHGHFRQGERTA